LGALRGVPFLVKDLVCTTAGDPCHAGSRYLRAANFSAPEDTSLAAHLRGAGLVFVGRTNTPEFGLVTTTEPLACGPTRNPWSLLHSPGGSSGGSAAAVAAGIVPAAHANDAGGSIRIPAAHCGLVGLKPSRGRVSQGPTRDELWAGVAAEHVVTRSVRDSALLLDVTAAADIRDPFRPPTPAMGFAACLDNSPRPLRIGLMTRAPGSQVEVHPDCVAAVERTARCLEALGHHVEQAWPEALDVPDRRRAFMRMLSAWVAHDLDALAASIGRRWREDEIEPSTALIYQWGRKLSAVEYAEAVVDLQTRGRALRGWWNGAFDLLLTPTTAAPPPLLGVALPTQADPLAPLRATLPYMAFTAPFNISGQPAISVPAGLDAQGLPLGVQLVAAWGEEALLLQVAAALEHAQPWAHLRPPLLDRAAG
jgi:amidase